MKEMKKNNCIKKVISLVAILIMISSLVSCGSHSDMPYNGIISFHEITATIPESFIRDSTQSGEDVWFFERGFYKEYIILSRKDIVGDTSASLGSYVDYMKEQGVYSERTTFLQMDAVLSTYTLDDKFCQEMLFVYNGSFYAIALRGGTEEDFQSLLNTIGINDALHADS